MRTISAVWSSWGPSPQVLNGRLFRTHCKYQWNCVFHCTIALEAHRVLTEGSVDSIVDYDNSSEGIFTFPFPLQHVGGTISNTTEPCCWVLLSHFEISSLRYLIPRQAALLSLGFPTTDISHFPLMENVFLVTVSHSRSLHWTRTFPSQRGTRLVSSVSSS